MKQNMKKIVIGCTLSVLVILMGVAAWLIFHKAPVTGEQVAKNELGIDWYDPTAKEFTITTREELFELEELSYYYDFAGQTIYLGADIVVNEGNAADWENEKPEYEWESIYGFAGTFDGQGHTISGIYCIGMRYFANIARISGTNYVTAALFRDTQRPCVIKNFKLVNSYFESDLDYGVGSISSNGAGTFDSIYSNAIVKSQKCFVGGLLGQITGDTTITNCWFDGSIETVMGYTRYVGGLASRAENGSKCKIEHCLVTADMSCDTTSRGNQFGGLLGQSYYSTVTITDCLMAGKVNNSYAFAGSITGNVAPESTMTLSSVFACADSNAKAIGYIEQGKLVGQPIVYDREKITGIGGYQWTTLDFEKYWAAVEGGTPVLKTFADDTLTLNGVDKMVDVTWYNEQEDTYVLMDEKDFFGFALLATEKDFAGKTIKLGADIKLNDGKASKWNKEAPTNKWISIGSKTLPFAGTFDGQMHTISGVYVKTTSDPCGLFGVTTQTATIKRLKLVNSYFESDTGSTGSIVARGVGIFDTIYSDAIVINNSGCIGGMIGYVTENKESTVKMTNCWFDGRVTNTSNETSKRMTGGLMGFVVIKVDVSNCLNTGTIDVRNYTVPNDPKSEHVQPYAGGLFGYVYPNSKTTITDCMSTGKILVSDAVTSAAGSILGYSSGTTKISNTYATKESCKNTTRGNIEGDVIVYEEAQITGYGGYQWTGLDFNKYWAVVLDDTSVLKSFAKSVPSLANVERKVDISWYNASAEYVLYDAADLRGFALLSKTNNFKGKTVKLANDIALNSGSADEWGKTAPETEWMSIGTVDTRFAGTFDGKKHTISGVYMNTDEKYTGFFSGTADEAVVKNFRLTNSYFYSTQEELGSIVGNARGKFDAVYSNAIVESSNNVAGGLIGSTSYDGGVKITNCWFDGEVTNVGKAASYYGGILARAYHDSTISNCLNTGTITCTLAKSPRAGGILGSIGKSTTSVNISDCLNTGEILHGKSTSEQGLIVGYISGKLSVENCYSTAQGNTNIVAKMADKNYPTCDSFGAAEDMLGTSALGCAPGLFAIKTSGDKYENGWVAIVGGVPVPEKLLPYTSGEQFRPDVSWYDGGKEYTLNTREQFFGLAVLANMPELKAFKGITVKLGRDIVINDGTSDNWSKDNAPKYEWTGIGTANNRFAGTFDGQMHEIRGIYLNNHDTTTACHGLFGATDNTAEIKNFYLLDSYFYSVTTQLGSITGNSLDSTFKTIYSDAVVESNTQKVGGFIGATSTSGSVTMVDCWFDGAVTAESGNAYQYGGLVGVVNRVSTFSNCMNTGSIDLTKSTANVLRSGGLVGENSSNANRTTILNSLQAGEFKYNTENEEVVNYGLISGYNNGNGLIIKNTFAAPQGEMKFVYNDSGKWNFKNYGVVGSEDAIKGIQAMVEIPQLFLMEDTYERNWSVIQGGVPVLTSFAKYGDGEVFAIDTNWYDDEKDSFELKDVADLYGFALISQINAFEDKIVKLGADIEVNKGKSTEGGWDNTKAADGSDITDGTDFAWVPIGNISYYFNGEFDGQMHTISGIYLDTSKSYQGLFSATATKANIKNFYLKNSSFVSNGATSTEQLGSIAGNARGNFENIYSNAFVASNGCKYAAGLLGGTAGSGSVTMKNCWFAGSVTANARQSYYGGLIGTARTNTTIVNCLNAGEVYHKYTGSLSTAGIGGFIGHVTNKATVDVSYSLNTANMQRNQVDAKYYGLFFGKVDDGTTVNANYSHSLNYTNKNLVGNDDAGTNPYSTCHRFNTNQQAGLIALTNSGTAWDNARKLYTADAAKGYWSITQSGLPVLTTFEKEAKSTAQAVDTRWYDASKNEYTLMDSGDLYGFALLSLTETFEGKLIKLGADIEVNKGKATATGWDKTKAADGTDITNGTDFLWLPIGWKSNNSVNYFNGEFDGQMHTISGIYLDTAESYRGLFAGTNTKAEIKNLYLRNSYFTSSGTEQLGSIVGNARGTFDNIYSDAIVVSKGCNEAGGLLGGTAGSAGVSLSNCWFAGSVTCNANKSYFGGLIGRVKKDSTIINCLNTSAVTHNGSVNTNGAGGLVGYVSGGKLDILHSVNAGVVTIAGGQYRGLFVGKADVTVNATNSHSLNKSGYTFVADKSNDDYPTCGRYTAEQVAGEKVLSQAKIGKLFTEADAKGCWSSNPNGFPVLTIFAEKILNQ